MKKYIVIFVAILLMIMNLSGSAVALSSQKLPSRVLNIVYDDSGSTIKDDNGKYVDTWCQAKYSMEVLASLLEEKDTLNIFQMSRNENNKTNFVAINGSDPIDKRVSIVHDMETNKAGNTPYSAVTKAYNHLIKQNADQKWLIILTDGAFNDEEKPSDLNKKFREYTKKGIKVIFLTIGDNADNVYTESKYSIYAEHASTSSEVIDKITTISNQIFERNSLKNINSSGGEFSFDVPMSELIVFAQGNNVKINGIESKNEKLEKVKEVDVKYSDKVAKNYQKYKDKIKIATELKGTISVFQSKNSEIVSGKYKLDVSGAQKVEIYYKPNIDVGIRIFQGNKDVTDNDALEAGSYTIKTGFLDDKSKDFIESSLLGNITSSAVIKNNGKKIPIKNKCFNVEIGDADINVNATFLKYNQTSISKKYKILAKVIPLSLTLDKKQNYNLSSLEDESILLTVKHDGKLLTKEKWDNMENPVIYCDEDIDFKVEKGKKVSTFNIIPMYKNGDRSSTSLGKTDFKVLAKVDMKDYIANGDIKDNISVIDDRSIFMKIADFLKIYWKWLVIFWIILCTIIKFRGPTGYFKRVLHPNVEMTKYNGKVLNKRDGLREPDNCSIKKNKFSMLPITPITIRAKISIRHVYCTQDAPALYVKSSGKSLILLNQDDYDIKKHPNICADLAALAKRKNISLGFTLPYSSETTIHKGSGMTNVKSSFVFRLK